MGWPRLFPSSHPPRAPALLCRCTWGRPCASIYSAFIPTHVKTRQAPIKPPLHPCGCAPSTHSHTRARIKPRTTTNVGVQNGESLATSIKGTEAWLFLFKSAAHARSSPQKTFCQQKFKVSRQARARFVWFGAASSEYPCFFPQVTLSWHTWLPLLFTQELSTPLEFRAKISSRLEQGHEFKNVLPLACSESLPLPPRQHRLNLANKSLFSCPALYSSSRLRSWEDADSKPDGF